MIRIALFTAPLALLSACTPKPEASHATALPVAVANAAASTQGACGSDYIAMLIGKKQSAAVEVEAKRVSSASILRWIRPGEMVTMDYRADRLNLRLGPDGRIARVSCG